MRATMIRAGLFITTMCPWAMAQTAWDVLFDVDEFGQLISESECGLVNAVDFDTGELIQLVILQGTGELLIVETPTDWRDRLLFDAVVDATNIVCSPVDISNVDGLCFGPNLLGEIRYFYDGDAFRTVWWVWFDETVLEVALDNDDIITGQTIPAQYIDVPCNACQFVNFPPAGACEDLPGGGTNPPMVINFCGNGMGGMGMMAMTCCGFFGLNLVRRRM